MKEFVSDSQTSIEMSCSPFDDLRDIDARIASDVFVAYQSSIKPHCTVLVLIPVGTDSHVKCRGHMHKSVLLLSATRDKCEHTDSAGDREAESFGALREDNLFDAAAHIGLRELRTLDHLREW